MDRHAITTLSAAATSALNNRGTVNRLLNDSKERNLVLQRLQNYADFVNNYFGSSLSFDGDHIFYVKNICIGRYKLAILGLNSAWLCGSDKDRGEILIGERQVHEALDRAAGADIRIALVHHPFDWLKEFDRNDSGKFLVNSCNYVLHGHLHQTEIHQLTTPDSGAMIFAAGASFENREYPNTYNFVKISEHSGQITLRRYSDSSPGFWASDTLTYENARDGTYEFRSRARRYHR